MNPDTTHTPADRQEAAGDLQCERCGLWPSQHNDSHWCDNRTFAVSSNVLQQAYEQTLGKPVTLPESLAPGEDGALPNVVSTAPEKVWLIIGEDCPSEVRFTDLFGVTWSEDKIDDNSIGYVREDLAARAQTAAASPLSGEIALTRAISVMEDTLADIADWEDKALAEAIESSLTDLRAMVECIRMRVDVTPLQHVPAQPVAHLDRLHADIMNLRNFRENIHPGLAAEVAYKLGHRDARHAAAALVLTAQPAATAPDAGVREALETIASWRLVRFIGCDPLALTRGAYRPMIPDSWRFGFFEQNGVLCFGRRDEGELVAHEAVQPTPPAEVAQAAFVPDWWPRQFPGRSKLEFALDLFGMMDERDRAVLAQQVSEYTASATQAAPVDALPEYEDIVDKLAEGGALTALEKFILDNEPAGRDDETAFRTGLLALVRATPRVEARSLIEALVKHIECNECQHESTHRGGAIWTICDDCGKKWADDRGGFKPYVRPKVLVDADAYLMATRVEAKPLTADKVIAEIRRPCYDMTGVDQDAAAELFEFGVRFAERFHGIGTQPEADKGVSNG
jgi:ribosomal protein L37AE/L43A